jgi:hypothetical protein
MPGYERMIQQETRNHVCIDGVLPEIAIHSGQQKPRAGAGGTSAHCLLEVIEACTSGCTAACSILRPSRPCSCTAAQAPACALHPVHTKPPGINISSSPEECGDHRTAQAQAQLSPGTLLQCHTARTDPTHTRCLHPATVPSITQRAATTAQPPIALPTAQRLVPPLRRHSSAVGCCCWLPSVPVACCCACPRCRVPLRPVRLLPRLRREPGARRVPAACPLRHKALLGWLLLVELLLLLRAVVLRCGPALRRHLPGGVLRPDFELVEHRVDGPEHLLPAGRSGWGQEAGSAAAGLTCESQPGLTE